MNLARVCHYRRTYRDHLAACRPTEWPAEVLAAQKAVAEARMVRQDAMIAAGAGVRGRVSAEMMRAGPLRTDEWGGGRRRHLVVEDFE